MSKNKHDTKDFTNHCMLLAADVHPIINVSLPVGDFKVKARIPSLL